MRKARNSLFSRMIKDLFPANELKDEIIPVHKLSKHHQFECFVDIRCLMEWNTPIKLGVFFLLDIIQGKNLIISFVFFSWFYDML